MSRQYEQKVLSYLRNFREVAKLVKEIVKKFDPEVRVYVFGSVVTQRFTGASDIDILVITKNIDRKYDMMVEVYRSTDAPVELHIVTPKLFEKWYRRFINDKELIEI